MGSPVGHESTWNVRMARVLAALAAAWCSAAAAGPYAVMFERVEDAGAGSEVAFRTHASFSDLVNNVNSGPDQFSPINLSAAFNTTGLAWDGSQYIMMVERAEDAGSGSEVAFLTYASFSDLVNNVLSGPEQFSPMNVSAAFNTTGLDFDGNQYIMMLERVEDAGGGSEVAFLTYASFSDLINNVHSGPEQFSPINLSASFDTTGLVSEWQRNGGPTPTPEPGTLALLGLSLAGLSAARRRRH